MSAFSRIASGTVASWVRLIVGVGAQVLLVPIFLGHWDTREYGIWIGINAIVGLLQFLDVGHQSYIGCEALRHGVGNRRAIARLYSSAVRIAVMASVAELVVMLFVVALGAHVRLLGTSADESVLLRDAGIVLLLQSASWLAFVNWSSIGGRVLAPFGYYPQIVWWQVLGAVVVAVAPAVAVSFGAGLLVAGLVAQVAFAAYALPAVRYIRKRLAAEGLSGAPVDYQFGIENYWRSAAVSGRVVLDMVRQEQYRLLIAPFVGPANLALFVTTRTIANVMIAALSTFSGPVLPELSRYLNERDHARATAVMTVVWLIVVGALVPGAILANLFIAPVFSIWTRGRVAFDPALFGLLSIHVLLFAATQPAMAVLQSLNKIGAQLRISAAGSAIVAVAVMALVPRFGVSGAAAALVIGEAVAAAATVLVLRRTFESQSMPWPLKQVGVTVTAVMITCLFIIAATHWGGGGDWLVPGALLLAVGSCSALVMSLPRAVRSIAWRSVSSTWQGLFLRPTVGL